MSFRFNPINQNLTAGAGGGTTNPAGATSPISTNNTVLGTLTSPRRPQQRQAKQRSGGAVTTSSSSATTSATTTTTARTSPHKFSFLYALLNPKSRQWQAILFKQIISIIILIDLISFIFSTEPSFQIYNNIFHIIEGISSIIFLFEYITRIITCIERPKYRQYGKFIGRLRYMISMNAIIDAIATIPFFLEPLLGIELPRLTYLRFVRLLRITRTEGYMRAIDSVYRVIYYNQEIMYVSLFLCILLVLITGMLLYYTRPSLDINDDPEQFQSILATMYLATLLLTGQGGPQGDMPWYTKLVVLLTSFVSVAMFAIPASMLTWGFE